MNTNKMVSVLTFCVTVMTDRVSRVNTSLSNMITFLLTLV